MSDILDELWQELCDRDDRTSPAEYPDMCLITKEELSVFLASASFPPSGYAYVPMKMTAAMINAWSGGVTVTTDEIAYRTSFQDAWSRVLVASTESTTSTPPPLSTPSMKGEEG